MLMHDVPVQVGCQFHVPLGRILGILDLLLTGLHPLRVELSSMGEALAGSWGRKLLFLTVRHFQLWNATFLCKQ